LAPLPRGWPLPRELTMSRQTIREAVRMRLAEDSPNFWTPADLNRLMDWAHRQAVKMIQPFNYQRKQTINSKEDVDEYIDLPNDILIPKLVRYGDPTSGLEPIVLEKRSKTWLDREFANCSITSQEPQYYTLIGRGPTASTGSSGWMLILRPAALETISNGIEILYIERPVPFTSDNSEAKDPAIEDAMAPLIAFRCYKMPGGQDMKKAKAAWEEAVWLTGEAKSVLGIKIGPFVSDPCTLGSKRR